MMLRLLGHETRVAFDGASGLEVGAGFGPEVVLLDLGMPGLDGFATAERIRAAPWGQGLVLVAVTGWGQEEDRQRTRDTGFDRHLVKPIDMASLTDLLAG